MIDLTSVQHHPALEEIVEVLCNKTQNTDKGFFRVEVAYFMAKVAACMRASVVTRDRGEIPVNIYALALANSGYGKGHSVNLMEYDILGGFKRQFMEETLPALAESNLGQISDRRALKRGLDAQETHDKIIKEYDRTGAYPFTFDSGTPAAVKQLRHKLLLAGAGSINLQIDEIGSNLLGNVDVLNVFLELYDQGQVKQKLTKNTNENVRGEEVDGKTPTNMLLFGTPSKLLDGGQTEEEFYSFLETGYARRCLFGWGQQSRKAIHQQMSAEEIYRRLIEPTNSTTVTKWADHFASLAHPDHFNWRMPMSDEVAIKLLEYRMACEREADLLPEHEEIRKAELSHRYFKALKLSGAYAFLDKSREVTMEHLLQAILLVEESGEAFRVILTREKAYVKLAKFIASCETEVTHADLHEALPFYKQGNQARNELMTLAMAWGYKQHILIKKTFIDGIEFFSGETLQETNLNELILSHSFSWAYDYLTDPAPFDHLHVVALAKQPDGSPIHWANHGFLKGHRAEESAIPGFNLIVLDVDQGTPLALASELMKDYRHFIHTTKRHTKEHNRFRMVLPINYHLELDAEEYREFMTNLLNWLPFGGVDEAVKQRSKKWESFPGGEYLYNLEGETLDALKFIPKTAKNEQFQQELRQIENLSNLERWFAQRISAGNRNNQLHKYAMALADSGMTLIEVSNAVHAFNDKLQDPLRRDEINSTILRTVAKSYHQKQIA